MSPIHDEIRQSRPFPSKREEAAVALMRTADLVRRTLATVVEPHGITVQQYNVLRILRGAGESGLPTLDIAERMIEQTPGITRLLDRLEAKRLVSRERSAADRRQVFCRVTESGRALLQSLDEPIRQANERSLKTLEESEVSQLVDLLDRARKGLDAAVTARREKHQTSSHTRRIG